MGRVVVLGAGESGRGVALLARERGGEPFLSDAGLLGRAALDELTDHALAYEYGGHGPDLLDGAEVVVKSPGIPWEAPAVASARTRGVPVVGEMEYCARYAPLADGPGRPRLVGITGSNGKTTTTLLTTHLLRACGIDAHAGGNVGTSYARLLREAPGADVYVLELSSFQLEGIRDFHVDVGVVLNLSPDHLDRYGGSFADYAAAKYDLKRTLRPGATWLQPADAVSREHAPAAPAGVREVPLAAEFAAGRARTASRTYDLAGTALQGPHNAANASAALAICEALGAEPAVLADALATFRNAPHRLEAVGTDGRGVRYVDDSKATNLDAAAKALASFRAPVVWIAGGVDKGNDYAAVLPLVRERCRAVVAMGTDNAKLAAAFGDVEGLAFHDEDSLADTLRKCAMEARPGDVVLLAPACASFDLFADYVDRGEQFRRAVEALPDFTPAPRPARP